jgi:hypothetical protein
MKKWFLILVILVLPLILLAINGYKQTEVTQDTLYVIENKTVLPNTIEWEGQNKILISYDGVSYEAIEEAEFVIDSFAKIYLTSNQPITLKHNRFIKISPTD